MSGQDYSLVQMRSLDKAREAHKGGDVVASKTAHDTKVSASENHSKVGGYIKSIVFGGLDGIITTFAVVAGAAGGGLSVDVILILGFSSVFADAVSMGVGDALSTKAENEYILAEKRREEWEFENYPEGEIEEMVDLYESKGLPRKDAETVINIMAQHKDFFVNVMMSEELELQVPDEDENPWVDGGVTFCSFVVFGSIPLLAYAVFYSVELYDSERFVIACCLTAVCLFILGVFKSRFTDQKWHAAGTEILVLGGLVAALAYFIGWFVGSVILGGKGESGSIH